jgi:hypothetical protein
MLISYTEMWMPYSFNPEIIDKELELAESTGFNCLRVVLPFVVWEHDPMAFRERLAAFLEICNQHGINVMLTLFDDCAFGNEKRLKDPRVFIWAREISPSQPLTIAQWNGNEKLNALIYKNSDIIRLGMGEPEVWQHDLYAKDHCIYDKNEIELFRKYIRMSQK